MPSSVDYRTLAPFVLKIHLQINEEALTYNSEKNYELTIFACKSKANNQSIFETNKHHE